MKRPDVIRQSRWVLYVMAVSVAGVLLLGGGCPGLPTGGTTDGGTTDGGTTDGGTTDGGTTDGGTTDGGTTDGGTTDGGIEDIGGGTTDGGTTDGGTTDGGTTDGGGTTGGGTTGGGDTGDTGGTETSPTSVTLQQIAQTGDAVPGQPTGVTFTEFGNPVIDSEGRVAFWALYSGTGALGHGGLYVWDDGLLVRVVHDDPATAGVVPGRTTADYFGDFIATAKPLEQSLVWAGGDRLLFTSEVSGEKKSEGLYRWRATDGNLVRIGDREQVAALFPDALEAAFAPDYYLPGVTDGGTAVFGVKYSYFTSPPGSTYKNGRGLFLSNGVTVSFLVDSQRSAANPGSVPGQDATTYFTTIDTMTTVRASGDILFQSAFVSGSGNYGLYLYRNGTNYRVIDNRQGYSWPGLPVGALIGPRQTYGIGIGPSGHIAVDCIMSLSGTARDAVIVWDFSTSKWTEMTGTGGVTAKDLVSGVNVDGQVLIVAGDKPYVASAAGSASLVDSAPAELQSGVTWKSTGGAINNYGRALVPYERSDGDGLAFWTGERLLVVVDVASGIPAAGTAITTISDSRRDRPGRSSSLNDRDEMAFRVELGDMDAIYIGRGE